jgi:hypothetical protein
VIDRKPQTDNGKTVFASIDSMAVRDSRAMDKLQIAARIRVSKHSLSSLLVAVAVSSSAQATNE